MNAFLEGYSRRVEVHHFAASPGFHMPPTWKAQPAQPAACLSLFSSALRAEPLLNHAPIYQATTERPVFLGSTLPSPGTRSPLPAVTFRDWECHAFSSSLRQQLTRLMQGNYRPLHPPRQIVEIIFPPCSSTSLWSVRASWASKTRSTSSRGTGRAIVLVRSATATRLLAPTAAALLFETAAHAHLHLGLGSLGETVSQILTVNLDE